MMFSRPVPIQSVWHKACHLSLGFRRLRPPVFSLHRIAVGYRDCFVAKAVLPNHERVDYCLEGALFLPQDSYSSSEWQSRN